MKLRIGQGFDVHAFVPGRPLRLGGIDIPHREGLLGHSDADALLHAITDAILGAAGLGDIGRMFPDTDAAHRGADSRQLLQGAYVRVREAGWHVVNVDCVIVAARPRIAPHVEAMRTTIAGLLDVAPEAVGIKGKTTEHLGFTGRGEGIATFAVALLMAD
jgi:2-C-methyl-D-erythritol 2,4-cyclodiphosphate synthase